jgi:uncharacterized membrane protein
MAMSRVEKSIEAKVPIHTAYNQWTQFEEFPRFVESVKEVRQIDDTHLHWRARFGGRETEWDAVINEQVPDERIAWHSTNGAENAGTVVFHRLTDNKTRITLQLGIDPEGFVENIGDKLGFVSHQVDSDLEHFRDFVEDQGTESGGWRGKVHRGDKTSS